MQKYLQKSHLCLSDGSWNLSDLLNHIHKLILVVTHRGCLNMKDFSEREQKYFLTILFYLQDLCGDHQDYHWLYHNSSRHCWRVCWWWFSLRRIGRWWETRCCPRGVSGMTEECEDQCHALQLTDLSIFWGNFISHEKSIAACSYRWSEQFY